MTSRYIATTGLSELWSRQDPVLLLGPWCRRGLTEFSPAYYEELPCIWDREHSIVEAEIFCWDLFCRWAPRLGEALNRFHHIARSRRYWEILLSVWFLHFINVMYDRYLLLRSAARTEENSWTTVLPRESYTVAPTSFSAIKCFAYDDAYNLQLFSEAARFLGLAGASNGPARWNGSGAPEGEKAARWQGVRKSTRRILGTTRSNLLRRIASTTNRLALAFTGLENDLMLCLGGHYKPLDLLSLSLPARARLALPGHLAEDAVESVSQKGSGVFSGRTPDPLARQRVLHGLAGAEAQGFEALVLSSTPYFIPTCFVEGYPALVAESRKGFGAEPRSVVFDAPSLYDDSSFLEYAARSAEAGKKLFSIQHGGVYGHALSSPAERIEVELSDGFFSFGWRDDRFPQKVLPLPNSHLCSLIRSRKPGAAILYVSFFGKTYLHRLVSVPHGSQWDDYLRYCETFLETLNGETLSKVRFRPYFGYGGYTIPPLMESLMKGAQREKRIASRALADCRLAVIDHASTSWIEAMACNTPTVLFWNPSHWQFRPSAQPSIERLARAGILHFDPVSAARKVEEVYDHAEDWWANDEIQSARRDFCRHYAWGAADWRRYWIEALREVEGAGAAGLSREEPCRD